MILSLLKHCIIIKSDWGLCIVFTVGELHDGKTLGGPGVRHHRILPLPLKLCV